MSAVDLEQARLEGIISLVWEDHYAYDCTCESCKATRDNLSPTDLHFVDHLSKTMLTKVEIPT